jgi:curved DNA-binding protein CbpA
MLQAATYFWTKKSFKPILYSIIICLIFSLPLKFLCKLAGLPLWCSLILGGLIYYIVTKVNQSLHGINNNSTIFEFFFLFFIGILLICIITIIGYPILLCLFSIHELIQTNISLLPKILADFIHSNFKLSNHNQYLYMTNTENDETSKEAFSPSKDIDTVCKMESGSSSNQNKQHPLLSKYWDTKSPHIIPPRSVLITREAAPTYPMVIERVVAPYPYDGTPRLVICPRLIEVETTKVNLGSLWPEYVRSPDLNYKGELPIDRSIIPYKNQSSGQLLNTLRYTSENPSPMNTALYNEALAEYKRRAYLWSYRDEQPVAKIREEAKVETNLDNIWTKKFHSVIHPHCGHKILWDSSTSRVFVEDRIKLYKPDLDIMAPYYTHNYPPILEEVDKTRFITNYLLESSTKSLKDIEEAERVWKIVRKNYY